MMMVAVTAIMHIDDQHDAGETLMMVMAPLFHPMSP
jgi:hypothetical protein